MDFGRYAEEHAKRHGKKPATFDFLGFTYICARSRRGQFMVNTKTMKKRLRRGLTAEAEWCQEHRHEPVDKQLKTLNAKLGGHYQYYERPTNSRSQNLAEVAQSPNSQEGTDVGEIYRIPPSPPLVASLDQTILDLGTVRGVAPEEPAAWKSARLGL